MFKLSQTPFEDIHVCKLKELWELAFEGVEFQRQSEAWKEMGFQHIDPSSDFRGVGLLGLQNLIFFANKNPLQFEAIIKNSRSYPFAAAGLNITQYLLSSLNLLSSNHLL